MWISKKLNSVTLMTLVAASTTTMTMTFAQNLCDTEERAYNIDFSTAIVTTNTLHQIDGELRYENLGETYNNQQIDFVVKVLPGTSYTTPDPDLNGRSGFYGQINVQNRLNQNPELDGIGEFEFCFINHDTNAPVTIDNFDFTLLDLDSRGDRSFEKVTVHPSQYEFYQLLSSAQSSTVAVQCESGRSPPCDDDDDNICFISNESGNNNDNPTSDPSNFLSTTQKRRSVMFTFVNKSCFQMKFEQVCNDGVGTCNVGGNFIFATTSVTVSENNRVCVPGSRSGSGGSGPSPTSPTRAPVNPPTRAPVPAPTPTRPTGETEPTEAPISDGYNGYTSDDSGSGSKKREKKPKSSGSKKSSKKLNGGKGKGGSGSSSKNGSDDDGYYSKKEKKPKSVGDSRKHASKKLTKNDQDSEDNDGYTTPSKDSNEEYDDDDYVIEPGMDSEDVALYNSNNNDSKHKSKKNKLRYRR